MNRSIFQDARMESGASFGRTTSASNPIVRSGREFPLFSVTILGLAFLIDMSPEQLGLRDLQGAATLRDEPFYLLPPKLAACSSI
jgi:hypothetical protein